MQKQINICDIFREYGESYITRHNTKGPEKGIIRLLSACRTDALGSHYGKCDRCDYLGRSHNSCRNRHCPVCQQKDKEKWLGKRMEELLPVGHYHLVFTIPHQLNGICRQNKKVMYAMLFKAASQTVLELAGDVAHMGADTGLAAILHTWGQSMTEHPHLHCIMPAGGLSFDRQHWVHANKKDGFFVHYKAISRKFRGKYPDMLQQAFDKGELSFGGQISGPATKRGFSGFIDELHRKEWAVNNKSPLANLK